MGPIAAPPKGAQQPATFRSMSIVAKRSPISATAELLLPFIFAVLLLRYNCKNPSLHSFAEKIFKFWKGHVSNGFRIQVTSCLQCWTVSEVVFSQSYSFVQNDVFYVPAKFGSNISNNHSLILSSKSQPMALLVFRRNFKISFVNGFRAELCVFLPNLVAIAWSLSHCKETAIFNFLK